MPNIVSHFICGKKVAEKLSINNVYFLKGNLYPDYIGEEKHYRVEGKKFQIPDIDRFIEEEKMENSFFKLGFLNHLILDKLFLDDYVINNIYSKIDWNMDIFVPDGIYQDYTNISKRLLVHYGVSLAEIDWLMLQEKEYINFQKYINNTDIIRKSTSEELKYLNFEEFTMFLDSSIDEISTYIKKKYKKEGKI